VGRPVFKTGEGDEKSPWWVRFPCASAKHNNFNILQQKRFTVTFAKIPLFFPRDFHPFLILKKTNQSSQKEASNETAGVRARNAWIAFYAI